MIKLTILLTVLLIASAAIAQSRKEQKINDLIKSAGASEKVQDYAQAINYYTQIIALDPSAPRHWYLRANAYYRMRRDKESIADYSQLINLYKHETSYAGRAFSYLSLENYDSAEADLRTAMAINSTFGDAYLGLARVKYGREQFDSVFWYLDKAEKNGSVQERVLSIRATTYGRTGKYAEAVTLFSTLSDRFPTKVPYLVNLGYYNNRLGKYEEAIRQLNMALQLDSNSADAYSNKSLSLLKLRKFDEALLNADMAIRLSKTNPNSFITRGEILAILNRVDKACADFGIAAKLKLTPRLKQELNDLQLRYCMPNP